jgi:hypothetical protein
MIKVKAKYIKFAYPFAAKEDTRYYLEGIYIEPHQKKAVLIKATDGHIAAIFYDEEGICETAAIIQIDKEAIDKCRSPDLHLGLERSLIVDGPRLSIRDHQDEHYIQPGNCIIDAKYPDIAKIIPPKEKLKPGITGIYAAPLLATLNFENKPHQALHFFQEEGPEKVLVIRIERMPEFIGFIMPMRPTEKVDPIPDWLEEQL